MASIDTFSDNPHRPGNTTTSVRVFSFSFAEIFGPINEKTLLTFQSKRNPISLSLSHKQTREYQGNHIHENLPKEEPYSFHQRIEIMNLMKLCQKEKNIYNARRIHADIVEKDLIAKDACIGTSLITTYAKCRDLEKAREVFEQLPVRDVVSWNALISGYAQHGFSNEALKCFKQMQEDVHICPNVVTYICILKACTIVGSLQIGEYIAAEVRKRGLLHKDVVLGTALVDMYAKCGALEKAQEVFECLPMRNVVTWSALITGYTQHGLGDEALKCFQQMQTMGVCPNAKTYACILKACAIVGSLEIGEDIDAEVKKKGLLENDVMLGNALVDMYAKCGALEKARDVFEKLQVRNVATWNALITGYVHHGCGHEALKCFKHMRDLGIGPNVVTYICILKACGIVGSLEMGEDLDIEVRKHGLLQKEVMLGNALVDMYSKCGALEKAHEVFLQLPEQNVISWNAMITGYVHHGLGYEALKYFKKLQDARICPDVVTYICVLKACGIVGSLEVGKDIDTEVRRQGLLQKDILLGTTLVDMYSKCSAIQKAQEIFEQLPVQNVASWSALISGYAQLGQANSVLNLYKRMRTEGIMPNSVTFIVLLTACSHAGLIKEGEKLFDDMCAHYFLSPTLEHYTCMIDLFGRAGHFDKVKALLDKVAHSTHIFLFLTVLGACKEWRNVKLGKWAFDKSIHLDEKCAGAYICMQNIYVSAGMQKEAHGVKNLRVKNKAWVMPECCWWTDVHRNPYCFRVSDRLHPENIPIHAKLEKIHRKLIEEGCSPGLDWVLPQAMVDEKEENVLCDHGIKLAIACALIHTPDGMPIHVSKNMRMCHDCHFSTSLISRIEKRRIQVNDAKYVHSFENGECTCG